MSKEIDAIKVCCDVLEPIKDDQAAIDRVFAFLRSRFPSAKRLRQDRRQAEAFKGNTA